MGNIALGPDGEYVDESDLYRAQHEHDGMYAAFDLFCCDSR